MQHTLEELEFIQHVNHLRYPKIKLNIYEKYLLRKIQLAMFKRETREYFLCVALVGTPLSVKKEAGDFRCRLVKKIEESLQGFRTVKCWLENEYSHHKFDHFENVEDQALRIAWIQKLTGLKVDWDNFNLKGMPHSISGGKVL